MDLIFFGMQGAGKGTLGKAVAERYGMEIFETGGELRKLSQMETPLAIKVKNIINSGNLVPNEVVMEIVENFMNNLEHQKQILFDGIPRSVFQAETLNTLLNKHQHNYKAVLIDISRESALKRLTSRRICENCKTVYPENFTKNNCAKCAGKLVIRADDNPEAIQKRLDLFERETLPAIDFYAENLIKIDGEPSIEAVEKKSFEKLDSIMGK